MKLNKKTIYKVDTKEKFNAMMKDAKEQGYYWCAKGDADTHPDYWDIYTDDTYVRITKDGYMMYGTLYSYGDGFTDHAREDYVLPTTIYPLNFGCVGIDAPDFKTAYEEFRKRMRDIFDDKSETNTYTVRVDDNNTTVITPDGKVAIAKCHPDDEFDIVEGFRVALEKIKDSERKLTDEEFNVLNALQTLGCDTFRLDIGIEVIGFKNAMQVTCIDLDGDFDEIFNWLEDEEVYNIDELLEKYA